jgi:integrase
VTVHAVNDTQVDAEKDLWTDLWTAIDPEFLRTLGWDRERRVLRFPEDHPLLGWAACKVMGCRKDSRQLQSGLCSACSRRWKSTRLPLDEFLVEAKPAHRCVGTQQCAVEACQRPATTVRKGLCSTHEYQQRRIYGLSVEAFLAQPDLTPLAPLGPCAVAACTRERSGKGPYCRSHQQRFKKAVDADPHLEVDHWRRTSPAVAENSEVSLRGLHPQVVAEVIYGLQERVRREAKVHYWEIRPICDELRRIEATSITELSLATADKRKQGIVNGMIRAVRRHSQSPETERSKNVWDLHAFGHQGTLNFTQVSQIWLREAVKLWAADDLPQRRGNVAVTVQARINAIVLLSASLRIQRDDDGNRPAALSRQDITNFCNRLAYLAEQGTVSYGKRLSCCRHVRLLLDRMRKLGLGRAGMPLHTLPDDFALTSSDIPDEPEDAEAGKDLPLEVMRHLCEHLPALDTTDRREVRVAVELMIDTGRRPDEICELTVDCLERDGDGKPVLIYDNHKAHRHNRRLPIPEATAALIITQQTAIRARFPDTPTTELKLLPTPHTNPTGRKAISDSWVSHRHREWVNRIPDVRVPLIVDEDGKRVTRMLPFDKVKIFPYAYRHTYAQRHADAGVDVTVLRELMDHRQLSTTQGYYNVGQNRRRDAVERVTTMQFDRHGNRVWRNAKALLDSEHARRAVGEVAVPYGGCSEPSNVAASGQDCPVRFRCIGCGHFSTDISYLPDLERHLADLLRHRERLAATLDADEWAKSEAMPSDNEISRIRRLIDRMKSDIDELTAEDRAQIDEAIAVVRQGRAKVVGLGMPRVRQPLPDVRPERSA